MKRFVKAVKNRVQNSPKKTLLCAVLLFVALLFIPLLIPDKEIKPVRIYGMDYKRDFNDMNYKHLSSAKSIGIVPFTTRDEAERTRKKVVKLESNGYYDIRDLNHSVPYVVSETADLLNALGRNFCDSLKKLNAPLYKLQITSITRTKEDLRNLRRVNLNSSENSAHLYGTTFDVSWSKFNKTNRRDKRELSPDDLKRVLGLALRDLKRNEQCYVKHEKKQACFHVTAR